jgi:hypothetical protein
MLLRKTHEQRAEFANTAAGQAKLLTWPAKQRSIFTKT